MTFAPILEASVFVQIHVFAALALLSLVQLRCGAQLGHLA